MAHFMPYHITYDASNVGNLDFREAVRLHGILRGKVFHRDIKIISDL